MCSRQRRPWVAQVLSSKWRSCAAFITDIRVRLPLSARRLARPRAVLLASVYMGTLAAFAACGAHVANPLCKSQHWRADSADAFCSVLPFHAPGRNADPHPMMDRPLSKTEALHRRAILCRHWCPHDASRPAMKMTSPMRRSSASVMGRIAPSTAPRATPIPPSTNG